MSNSGYKNVTRVDSDACSMYGFLVRVQWRRDHLQAWVPDADYRNPLVHAVRLRNRFERQLGKPRTEHHVRSSGRIPWLRRRWSRKEAAA